MPLWNALLQARFDTQSQDTPMLLDILTDLILVIHLAQKITH
jgi:hypothetical protein